MSLNAGMEQQSSFAYGSHGELATNDREDQEITVLSLQLLQNCMMLINTILIQTVLQDDALLSRLTAADLRGLSPSVFHSHQPIRSLLPGFDEPSFLEAA